MFVSVQRRSHLGEPPSRICEPQRDHRHQILVSIQTSRSSVNYFTYSEPDLWPYRSYLAGGTAMAADEVAMLNMFMSIALAATLAMRSLQPISTELPGPSWKAISQAEAC